MSSWPSTFSLWSLLELNLTTGLVYPQGIKTFLLSLLPPYPTHRIKSLTIVVKQKRPRTPSRSLGQEQGEDFNGNSTGFAGLVHCRMASRPQQFPCLTLALVRPTFSSKCQTAVHWAAESRHPTGIPGWLIAEEWFPSFCHPTSVSFIEEKRGREGREGGGNHTTNQCNM